jgi:predicted CopG family antitoxin
LHRHAVDISRASMHDPCMATKTITIDMEAYEALRRRKGKGESFSDVIKRHFHRGLTGKELLTLMDDLEVGEDMLDAADELIRDRGRHPARAPEL